MFFILKDFLVKVIRIVNPLHIFERNKLLEDFEDLLREVEKFALFIEKGQTEIKKYRIKNTFPYDFHYSLYFYKNDLNKRRSIGFMMQDGEKYVSLRIGSSSSASVNRFSKKELNYEDLAKKMYFEVERYTPEDILNGYKNLDAWKKIAIEPIIQKYALENNFYVFRRTLILITHESFSEKYKKTYRELLILFNNSEKDLNDFVEEIESAYLSKIVLEKLE